MKQASSAHHLIAVLGPSTTEAPIALPKPFGGRASTRALFFENRMPREMIQSSCAAFVSVALCGEWFLR